MPTSFVSINIIALDNLFLKRWSAQPQASLFASKLPIKHGLSSGRMLTPSKSFTKQMLLRGVCAFTSLLRTSSHHSMSLLRRLCFSIEERSLRAPLGGVCAALRRSKLRLFSPPKTSPIHSYTLKKWIEDWGVARGLWASLACAFFLTQSTA